MENISKRFPGVQALDDVDFEVYPGEILGFLGENGAGKSTLVKILSGVYTKDQGTIWFKGQPVEIHSPHEAQDVGHHDHLPGTGAGALPERRREHLPEPGAAPGPPDRAGGLSDCMKKQAEEIMADLGVEIPGDRLVKDLTVAAQQMVEIAKAVSRNASLILMDEPTSALSSKEVDALFNLMRRLKEKGVSVVFISHRLEEVLAGRGPYHRHARWPAGGHDGARGGHRDEDHPDDGGPRGRSLPEGRGPDRRAGAGSAQPVRRATASETSASPCTQGEIVGLAGLVGAGRTEVARLICGADRITGGDILIEGKQVKIHNTGDAVEAGIGWVPEDRKQHGLVLGMDVKSNISLAILKRISGVLGAVSAKDRARHRRAVRARRCPSPRPGSRRRSAT